MKGFRWSLGTFLAGAAIFITVSGWAPRAMSDRYEPVALSPEMHRMVSAYIGPMQRYAKVFHAESCPKASDIERVTDSWIEDYEAGRIGELLMRTGDDSCRDGVKSQIVDARDTMACALRNAGKTAERNGDWAQSARLYRKAGKLLEILKYSDLPQLSASLGYQNTILAAAAALPPEYRRQVFWTPASPFLTELRRLTRVEIAFDDGRGAGGRVVNSRFTAQRIAGLASLDMSAESVAECLREFADFSKFPARPAMHVRMSVKRWFEQNQMMGLVAPGDRMPPTAEALAFAR